jgi:hypothetical protein
MYENIYLEEIKIYESEFKFEEVCENDIELDNEEVKAAKLYKLINNLIETNDIKYIDAFFLTHKSFTTSTYLLQNLITRYENLLNTTDKNYLITKTISTINYWLTNFFEDFDCQLIIMVLNLYKKYKKKNPDLFIKMKKILFQNLIRSIYNNKNINLSEKFFIIIPKQQNNSTQNTQNIVSKIFSIEFLLTDYSALEIASQMTKIDFEIFSKIKPHEFFDLSWSKSKKETNSPNIYRFIQRLNNQSNQFVKFILSSNNIKTRAQILKLLLETCTQLLKMNNFNAIFTLSSVFNNSSINRLKKTWALLSKNDTKVYEDIESLLKPSNNFKILRDIIESSGLPCIPHLGIYLTVI